MARFHADAEDSPHTYNMCYKELQHYKHSAYRPRPTARKKACDVMEVTYPRAADTLPAMSRNIMKGDNSQPQWVRTIGYAKVRLMGIAHHSNNCNLTARKTGVTQAEVNAKQGTTNGSPRANHTHVYQEGVDAV